MAVRLHNPGLRTAATRRFQDPSRSSACGESGARTTVVGRAPTAFPRGIRAVYGRNSDERSGARCLRASLEADRARARSLLRRGDRYLGTRCLQTKAPIEARTEVGEPASDLNPRSASLPLEARTAPGRPLCAHDIGAEAARGLVHQAGARPAARGNVPPRA